MATAKLLSHILAKKAQEFGRALGPNQHVPSSMTGAQQPISTNTPMNGARPAVADVPPVPAVPAVPVLPGLPGAAITSPTASGSMAPGPNKNVANFAKTSAEVSTGTGVSSEAMLKHRFGKKDKTESKGLDAPKPVIMTETKTETKVAMDPISAGALGAVAGVSTEALLKHLIALKKREKKDKHENKSVEAPKPVAIVEKTVEMKSAATGADFTGEKADPAFAKQMADQAARVNAAAKATAAKAKVGLPLKDFTPRPKSGMPKMNSSKTASTSCAPGTIKAEPATNLKKALPKPALMKTETAKMAMSAVEAALLGAGIGGAGGAGFGAGVGTNMRDNARRGDPSAVDPERMIDRFSAQPGRRALVGGGVGAAAGAAGGLAIYGASKLLDRILAKKKTPRKTAGVLDRILGMAGGAARGVGRAGAATLRGVDRATEGVVEGVRRNPRAAILGATAAPLIAPAVRGVRDAISPPQTNWDKIKATGSDVLGKTTDFAKGFAKNPLEYDATHAAVGAAGVLGAGLLLNHLLKKRKQPEPEYAVEG